MIEHITFKAKRKQLRKQGHFFFDLIWKNELMTRTKTYNWLALKLEIDINDCHFTTLKRKKTIEAIKVCIDFLNSCYTHTDLPKYKY